MPTKKLLSYLDDHQIKYEVIRHPRAYTAQEVAGSAHIPGQEMAKTVIVKLDGKMAMAVLPATAQVDFDLLQSGTGAKTVELATEADFREVFTGCDVGAMPPFGNLYGVPVYVAEALAEDEQIGFNACTHTDVVRMRYDDFERLVQPTVIRFADLAV